MNFWATIRRHAAISAVVLLLSNGAPLVANGVYKPEDPIASIDAQPVFLGELNLILKEQLGAAKLGDVKLEVKRAAALILVRRRLAMRSLRERGGDALEAIIRQQIQTFAKELQRRGSSLAEYARQHASNEKALQSDLAWRAAWEKYLASKLTDENLERFYEPRKLKYAGGRWDVSQIFLEVDRGDSEALSIARYRSESFLEQLEQSSDLEADFARLARDESDSGSAAEGGRIGWVDEAGDLPLSVMAAVRRTAPGTVAKPVRSALGVHIVLVHRVEARPIPFQDLEDRSQLRRDAANALFQALVQSQRDAKVVWLISALAPPADVPVIPGDAATSPAGSENRQP